MLPSRMLFDDLLDDMKPLQNPRAMMCDIYEEDGKYFIEMDAPGFKKEDITIECDKGNLKITAEKKFEENTSKKYIHREKKTFERCERSFYLGNVDEDAIKAEFIDGILKIMVPKEKEIDTSKKITID